MSLRYSISPSALVAHTFDIRCVLDVSGLTGQAFALPTWIPGSYLIREFARNIISIRAEAADGAVSIVKTSKNTWRVDPCRGRLTVTATVYAYDLSVRAAYLDDERGFFTGTSVFLMPLGYEQARCEVEILAPDGDAHESWQVATTLTEQNVSTRGFGTYCADSYDALIDHPVLMGNLSRARFEAGGVPHEVAVSGRHHADLDRMAADLARVCETHIGMFHGKDKPPFDRYLFQVMAVGDGYGGLEHRSSTSLICRRDELPAPGAATVSDGYLNFLGLASHEYFHAWNVKRIKPAAFVPYDLARENYTRQLWAFEGVTSYYDDLALVRSGLIDAPRYLELLARAITSVLRVPGRHVQSVAESSFDAWIKF